MIAHRLHSAHRLVRRSARGFALPVVLLLSLLVGIVAAVVLERQGNQRQVVERELRGYQSRHFERGVREVVGAWTDTLAGQPISKMVDEVGHALDLVMPDGSYAAIFLYDGQGSVLIDPSGLTQQEVEDGGGVLDALGQICGYNPDPSWLRPVGPVAVCIASAPPEVIQAIGRYAGGERDGERGGKRFVQSLAEARTRGGEITQADLNTAMSAAGLTAEEQQIVQRLVVLEPTVWGMVVDVYDPVRPGRNGAPSVRYAGRFEPPGANNRQSSLQTLGKFLSWEELPVEGPATP